MTIKEGLCLTIDRAREREASELYPRCNDELAEQAEHWTIKDTIAHLSAWRGYAVAVAPIPSSTNRVPSGSS